MLAVAKTPRIDLKIKGEISPTVLRVLKKEYGKVLVIKHSDKRDMVDYHSTSLHKELKKYKNPGVCVKIHRENMGFTQTQLGDKIGVKGSFISDIENSRRDISKDKAKMLSKLFKTLLENLL